MRMRWKKFFGIFLLIGVISVYSLLVMRVAVSVLPDAGPVGQFFFYAIAGMAWVIPVRHLIVWMNKPGRKDLENGEAV